ncbi:coiled-coil domain-containing protein mad1 [Elasticomyces elasticus]|nr:coiled-coil domain-containing protein mad1 [Elasticomyces elasticus]
MAAARNQPTYDFLSGNMPSPPRQILRETLKQSMLVKADIGNEQLRAQINSLQYELETVKQERELAALRHQSEIRELQTRAEADFKRAQTAETTANTATKKLDAVVRGAKDDESRATNEKLELERKLRTLQEQNHSLREELEEAKAELLSEQRHSKHAYSELETRHASLQSSYSGLQQDLDAKVASLQTTQQRLSQREAEVGSLENEVIRLKAQTGDADMLAAIKRELTEQVTHIKKLESTNREQLAELKQLRKIQKNIDVVEEEKRTLESKVRMMDGLRRELAEAQLQVQILKDEKHAWTSYLENEAAGQIKLGFHSPEEMAKAFAQERLERATLMEKLGALQPELIVKEEIVRSLEDEKAKLTVELEKMRTSGSGAGDGKARARLERQKNLAVKEIEYLRAQVKTFEAEETEFRPEMVDEQKANRVQELEDLVDQYRKEMQVLQTEVSKLEAQPAPTSPLKRPRSEEDDERLGELRRKTRTLQDEVASLQSRNALLDAELKANISQLTSLKDSSRTRILSLRSNPTDDFAAATQSTLAVLRAENRALLDRLEGRPGGTKVVPISTLDNTRGQLAELQAQLAAAEKKTLRLKQIWSSKSLEFREAVASVLGWKLDFMPNGRVKATSILYPALVLDDGEEAENSIVFDGENGTMKVSGGPQSVFAGQIRSNIEFWVEQRKEVPCFLAQLTLDFYEMTTRAARM